MPRSSAPSTVSTRASSPAACPSVRGRPRRSAHRPLPSMTQAMWAGMRSGVDAVGDHLGKLPGEAGRAGDVPTRPRPSEQEVTPCSTALRTGSRGSHAAGRAPRVGDVGRWAAVVVDRPGRVPVAVPAAAGGDRRARLRVRQRHRLRRRGRRAARAHGLGRRTRCSTAWPTPRRAGGRRPSSASLGLLWAGPRRGRHPGAGVQRHLAGEGPPAGGPSWSTWPGWPARASSSSAHWRSGPAAGALPGPAACPPSLFGLAATSCCSCGCSARSPTSPCRGRPPARGDRGAIGLEVLKLVGTVYVPRAVASSSALYGSLGVVFAILAWLAIGGPAGGLRLRLQRRPPRAAATARSRWRSRCPASRARSRWRPTDGAVAETEAPPGRRRAATTPDRPSRAVFAVTPRA